ncbi:DsbA family oxidoreductase [Altererythrobacter sp. CC-YST694]|uniref:DsbA family oxidoreductase n=1 Tax=Altererythrobacter sp. CC-YST694 TaxID=2755038 RepID=UPI001D02FE21|nr:DsbA family oxidoreductase [Altererythrobacter sp. CC-YST694]MCB5424048.1 DsbA family oxidoreductase [Altererythrobacter sp. CC-YST694]
MSSETLPKVTVDIWSDVMCPWCAIGYTQFAKALKELEGEIDVEVRFMPFELNPDMPPEGRSQTEHLAAVYGRSPAEVEDMRQQMLEVAARAGFPMEYDGEGEAPEPWMWNTFDAHKLLRWALTVEGMEAQTALKLALFRAHFQQRRRIGKRSVLLDVAENLGFDRTAMEEALEDEALGIAVRLEERRAREANITSVPSFIINDRYLVPGAQEPEVYRETLRKVVELSQAE